MALDLFLTTLDQEDGRQDQESAGNGGEPDVAEVVPQDDEHRYQAETKPPRQAA
jgi:hypothetical protein